MKDALRTCMRRIEFDRAVFFGVLVSAWQMGSAPVTIILISLHLTPEMQGFYYTFGSLLALQSFLELGLYVIILNVASHEWAHLELDENGRIFGDSNALSRLVSLGRFIFKWYAVVSVLFIVCVGTAGQIFFSQESYTGVTWQNSWWALVILSGLLLWTLPFNSLLEGCNQVATIQKFRLSQMIIRNLMLWLTLILGGGLWALVVATGVAVLRDVYLLGGQYRRFFKPFLSPPTGPQINWKTEIWPMQSRLAVESFFGYFLFSLFNPVMFHYHGAVVAGRMGMTLSVASAIKGVASMWVQPKVPKYGMLIARKDYTGLDRLWWRTTRASVAVAGLCAVLVWVLVYILNMYNISIVERLLSPLPTGLLLTATVLISFSHCLTVYLRAHKREPLLILSVVTSILMGLLLWALGAKFGPIGATIAYLVVFGGITLPWEMIIFFKSRTRWHEI